MNTSRISYGFLLSFLGGLLALRWWQPPYPIPVWIFLCGAVVLLTAMSFVLQKRTTLRLSAAVACGMLLACVSAQRTMHVSTPLDIESSAIGERATIYGWVTSPPDVRPTVTKLTISVVRIADSNGERPAKGKVLVNDYDAWPPVRYGDPVTAEGVLQLPEAINGFDYPHYLELSGARAIITRAKIEKASGLPQPPSARTWAVLGWLSALRTGVEDQIGMILPEPHASLLAGLLTGTRRGLSEELSDNFRRAGLMHIVAVSGYNVTIVLSLINSVLFWISVRRRFVPLAIMATLFALFTGAGAPVVRATIMGILGLLAISTERVASVRLLILWTALLMLMWNPLLLWYDTSFQLSFLAVIGLSELSSALQPYLKRAPQAFAIRESLTATLAAQIATIPFSILLFRQFSLIAPLTNIIAAPLIPLAMLLGFAATMFSFIWLPLGMIAGAYAWWILQLILWIAELGSGMPLASIAF